MKGQDEAVGAAHFAIFAKCSALGEWLRSSIRKKRECATPTLLILLFLASFCYAHEELSRQVLEITEKIRQTPNDAALYYQRAEMNRSEMHWKESEQDYLHARKLAPKMETVDLGLGLLYFDQKRFEDSLAAFNRFLEKIPDHATALVTRARIYVFKKELQKAFADYKKSAELRPDPAVYLEWAGLQHPEEALQTLNTGIERLGPVVTLELAAIELELQEKKYDSALARVDRIADQSERKENWLAKRGQILHLAGKDQDAKEAYLQALNAILALPESKRKTRFTQKLQQQIEKGLEELEKTPVE